MPYNIFRCFCKTFDTCSNTSLKPRYVAFLPHILMLVKNENFRFLPQSNFLTTEFFNEEFLARSSFLVKNFLQNQSSTSQLYIALSAINKYEILFWTDSSEKCKKMAKSAKSTSTDYLPNLERKKSKFWIFWNNYYNNRKMLRVLKQDPWARSFPILIFSRSFENFWKSRFFYPEIAFSWPQNASIIWRHLLFDPMSS